MRLVLFDVDGTLVDAGGAGRAALCRAIEMVFGAGGVSERTADVPFDGRTDSWIIAQLAARVGIPERDLASARPEVVRAYLGALRQALSLAGRARALPGVVALLDGLRRRGILLGLVTGNIRLGAEIKLAAAGLEGYFEEGAFGEDSADRVELGRLARERFESLRGGSLEPSRILLVGDSRHDIRAARANGYRSLAVETGWTRGEDLRAEGADRVLANLGDTAEVLDWIGPAG